MATEITADETARSDEAAARGVVDRVNAAWAAHDADAFADAYTEDATMVLSGDRYFTGRETIRAALIQEFQSRHRGTHLLADIVDVRFIGPDAAVLITEGGVLVPGETVPAEERAIRATWTLARQGGEWFIAAYQNTRNVDGKLPGA
ncbi:SgcJ/EcaC family oxidoreductase [Streptosporangium carneum]|nr:SgcJ/EcaC family oxidoreductase [Streptosporangium carneum]